MVLFNHLHEEQFENTAIDSVTGLKSVSSMSL